MDKISVIMGVYNPKDKKLFRNAIESILKQTYDNLEFIICDDCSNEYVKNIVSEYSKEDKRVVYIRNKKNMGLAYSLNNCLSVSTGNYIARQDDDDISKIDRLEVELDFLKRHKEYSFVGCNLELINSNGIWGERKHKEKPEKKDFLYGNQFPHPAMLFDKKVLDVVNGYRVCKKTRRTEDYDLFMRLYEKGYAGYNIQKCLYLYSEDMYGYSKRKFRYRIDEFFLRIEMFYRLKLMPIGLIYIFKPLISGIVPKSFLKIINKVRYKK